MALEITGNHGERIPSAFWKAVNLLFPATCLFCRIPLLPAELHGFLCASCHGSDPFFPGPGCPLCAALPGRCLCLSRGGGNPFSFAGTAALGEYGGGLKDCLHRLKYGGASHLAKPLGELLARRVCRQNHWHPVTGIAPVPLHPLRLRERGYNQSYLLARQLARALKVPLADILERHKNTPPQTGLSRIERMANPRGAFSLKEAKAGFPCFVPWQKEPPAGLQPSAHTSMKVILLVDDIFTTGSTLEAAAAVLLSRGLAARVYCAVVAR